MRKLLMMELSTEEDREKFSANFLEARSNGARLVLVLCWISVPLNAFWAFYTGSSIVVITALSAAFALAALASTRLAPAAARAGLGLGLVAQVMVVTAAFAGHKWQIDTHMFYFAMLAVLVVMQDIRAIFVAAAAVAVHHLLLTFLMPALIYPDVDATLFSNIQRTLIHAAAVVVETAVLVHTLNTRIRGNIRSVENNRRIEEAKSEAEESRVKAEALLAEAERSSRAAEDARTEAEAALARAAAETERAHSADAARSAAEERQRADQLRTTERVRSVVAGLNDALSQLSDQNLTARIEERFPEEYEELRANFNSSVETLGQAIAAVREQTFAIGNQIEVVGETAVDLARRTESQAHACAEITSNVTEVSKGVTEGADSVRGARDRIDVTRQEAEASQVLMQDAIIAMEEIVKSSEQIQRITAVIDDIAFQTNLLALNAGVEAARAGEAGRGFAVVASEVRALAQRSSEAATEIRTLIEGSGAQVKKGVNIVHRTGSSLSGMTEAVREIAEQVTSVADGAKMQAESFDRINEALCGLDRTTQQNAALFEETTATVEALRYATRSLGDVVAGFVTNPTGGAAGETVSPVSRAG